jgi:alpha-1,3-rhamnosyl/mannosyltransferase
MIGVRPEARAFDDMAGIPRTSFAVPRSTAAIGKYHAWIQLRASADGRRTCAALAHYTNGSAPLRGSLPYVVTVHDLSVMRMPQHHPLGRLATVPFCLAAIARARAVIVPSDHVRRELIRGLFVSERRVVSIEHAPAPILARTGTTHVLETLGLRPRGYLLSVGTIEPRKNLVRLVGAFERIAFERPDLKLVLVGSPGWRRGAISRRIEASPLRDRIVLTGYLPAVDVTTLIANAGVFCYVSIYEGFGLPVVEAMSAGAAVVTSRSSGMVQAAGGAAVLVDPQSEADIARGIEAALVSRDELIMRGRERAARRSWLDSASEHRSVYRWAARDR